jgi:trehalose utilization protein
MVKHLTELVLILAVATRVAGADVLIVADEFPAMQFLADKLQSQEHVHSQLVSQKELPASFAPFDTVVVYIHGALAQEAEEAFINYTKAGGKLVLLHHSISSGKRKNALWFSFLGVSLPEGELSQGGYKWIEGIKFDLVNLNPNHFIMTNRVNYPARIAYATTNRASQSSLSGFTLEHSEVYLNHVHTEPRALLMGLKYADEKTGNIYMQDTAGWTMRAGKGWIIYLMPGHTKGDFENPTYGQIVVNAVISKP